MAIRKLHAWIALWVCAGCGSSSSGGGSGSVDSSGAPGASSGSVASAGTDASSSGSLGSTSGSLASSGAADAALSGPITWEENGIPRTVAYATGARNTDATSDNVEIVGVSITSAPSLSMIVGGTPPVGGTYTCAPVGANLVEFTYALGAYTVQSCTVTISVPVNPDGGADVATGTFAAVLTGPDGGVFNITDGVFDVGVQIEH